MANREGTPIWYELQTTDPDAAKTFYDDVIGWTIAGPPASGMDYRMIDAGGGDLVGGMMPLTPEMQKGGARPGWLVYFGVADVDATVERVKALGGSVIMAPFDMPGAGRMAMVRDPQAIPFYVMRGEGEGTSHAWDRMGMGKCNWNELNTRDQAGALDFYARLFGWSYPEKMPMGAMGDYMFVDVAGGDRIGAIMQCRADGPPANWNFYFRAPDIEVAAKKVVSGGGTVHAGPMEVPGGDRIIVASDPQGVMFGVVGPGAQGGA